MSARDEILSRVRTALHGVERSTVHVPRGYRTSRAAEDHEMVIDRFVTRVTEYRATVERCSPDDLVDRVAGALPAGARTVVPPGLPWALGDAVDATVDEGLGAVELDRFDAVVTAATLGIAETGTIVLTHGAGEGRRALSLVPDVHVCVIRAGQVVADVPDAVARLDPTSPQTWISGPSATSDIELSRVEGVHGPRNLRVLVIDA